MIDEEISEEQAIRYAKDLIELPGEWLDEPGSMCEDVDVFAVMKPDYEFIRKSKDLARYFLAKNQ